MKFKLLIAISILTIEMAFSQFRYDIEIDSSKNTCSVIEISDKKKQFSIYKISNCKKATFYDNYNLLISLDDKNDYHFRNIHKLNEPVYFGGNIKGIISVENTKLKDNNESGYVIKYLNKANSICEMQIDKSWFMKLTDSCK